MQLNILLDTILDTEADALYIYLRDKAEKPVATMALSRTIIADLDKDGNIVGIEIVGFTRRFKTSKKKED